jgi:hypothetical protein
MPIRRMIPMSQDRSFIEQAVIPYFTSSGLHYDRKDNEVMVSLIHKPYRYTVKIIGYDDIGSLVIIYPGLAYMKAQSINLFNGLNGLNSGAPGKWVNNPDGEIRYMLDVMSLDKELTPESFKQFFEAALCTVSTLYEPLQRIVHAGMSFEDAIKYERKNGRNNKSIVDRQVESILRKASAKSDNGQQKP